MREGILVEDHATTEQSDIGTDGRAAVSLLGGGPGTEFLPRVSGAHHYFCSHDSSVTAWANWIRPDLRVHAFLGRCRNDSTESPHVSSRRGDCARVRRGLNRRIQFVVRPFGLGYGAEGIRAGHLVVMTLRHTFRLGRVSVHRVMGGVAAYLLIGLTWAFGYKMVMEERPDAIHFQSSIAGSPTGEPSRLIYFSFATLTSVSYGDAYPIHRVARRKR